jgi:SecD/SecF fusion protein
LDKFFDALKQIQKERKLASPDIFANRSLQGEGGVDFQMSDSEVQKVIKRKVEESVEVLWSIKKTYRSIW